MKTTIILIICALVIIYTSSPNISFKPFSLSFDKPYTPLGIIFMCLALICFNLQTRNDTRKEVIKTINEKLIEMKSNASISIED